MVTDLLQVGNKIDICALDKSEIKRTENGKVPILSSQLEAVEDNGVLTIQMPVYKGKIILLGVNLMSQTGRQTSNTCFLRKMVNPPV